MIVLRSLPLSLSILWRFAIVAPLWAVVYLLLTILAVMGGYVFGGLPVVGPYIMFAVSLAISFGLMTHPTLIGIRQGLLVLDEKIDPDQTRLMRASVGYGFIETVLAFVVSLLVFGLGMLIIHQSGSADGLLNTPRIVDPALTLSREMTAGGFATLWIIAATAALALRAALLPALAGAAAGYDPNGRPHTPLSGIGASFVPMFGVLLLTVVLTAAVLPVLSGVSGYLGLTNTLVNELGNIVLFFVDEEAEVTITLAQALQLAAAIVFSLWLFSLQCAGAALSYQARTAGETARAAEAPKAERISQTDLRALRHKRMGQS